MTYSKPGLLFLAAIVGSACSDNEEPPSEDHTPTSFSIQVNDVPVTAPYTFVSGQTVTVRIKFFNAAGADLDEVADSHFGGLAFEPTSLATVVRADHNYEFEVTGADAGTGTLHVSYGHNEAADEHDLPTAAVTVTTGGGPPPSR